MTSIARSIVTKSGIAAAALAGLVVLCALVLTFFVTRDQLRNSIDDQLDKRASLIAMHIRTTVEGITGNLTSLAANKLIANALADNSGRDIYLTPYLQSTHSAGSIPIKIQLSDYLGRAAASTLDPAQQQQFQDMLRKVVESNEPASALFEQNGHPHIALACPVQYANTGLPEGSLLYLLDFKEIVHGIFPDDAPDASFLCVWSKADEGGDLTVLQGKPAPSEVLSLRYRVDLPKVFNPWTLHIEVWTDKAGYRDKLWELIAGYAIISFLGIIALVPAGLLVSRGILKRLRELEFNARKVMETQSLEQRFSESGGDEIASLGKIFNSMLFALDQAQNELKSDTLREVRLYSERLKRVLANTTEGYARIDLSSRIVLEVNESLSRLIGQDQVKLEGSPSPDYFVAAIDKADSVEGLASWTEDELAVTSPDGTERFFLAKFSLDIDQEGNKQLVAFLTDITSRKLAEIALRESEEKLLAMSVSSYDALIMIDAQDTIMFWNNAAERLFGYTRHEAIGRKMHPLIALPEDQAKAFKGMPHFALTGTGPAVGTIQELLAVRKNGEVFPVERSVSSFRMRGRWFAVSSVRDISERRKVDKLKKEFISTVSHELRTPLTAIKGSLGLILGTMAGQLPEQVRQLLSIADSNSARLISLINDILDLEKLESGAMKFHMELIDLTETVMAALQENQSYADGHQVRLEGLLGDAHYFVMADKTRLAQVMANLLSNAAKFSPPGGTVRVGIRRIDAMVRVTVSDEGPGVPAAFHDRIFQKFAQADSSDTRQRGGTGLGLSITRQILEAFGGRIDFISQEGQGAEFFFELPLRLSFPEDSLEPADASAKSIAPHVE
jgi:PAS domain S-box-containing protein